jgi:hypothetical protein
MTPGFYGVWFGTRLTRVHAVAAWSGCHSACRQAGGWY